MTKKHVMCLIFAGVLLAIGKSGYSETQLSSLEKKKYQELIISNHSQIKNLFVNFDNISMVDEKGPMISSYDWAMSGDKRYRKFTYPTPKGSVPSERWGIAVWDGKVFKCYDSRLDNGGVSTHYSPADDVNQPPTYTPYSHVLGHLSKGTILELFATIGIDNWDAEICDDGKSVKFRTNVLFKGQADEWTFDLQKNYMISSYQSNIKIGNEEKLLCKVNVLQSKEVKPGIWLPTKSHIRFNVFQAGTIEKQLEKDIEVKNILVNDDSIDNMFHFEFPRGSQYYDYDLRATVLPYGSQKDIEQSLKELATDIQRSIDSNKPQLIKTTNSDPSRKALLMLKSTASNHNSEEGVQKTGGIKIA